MLPRTERLTTSIFTKVLKEGGVLHSPLLSLFAMKSSGVSRFSVSVPKKVVASAVGRNKIRRRVYSLLKGLKTRILPGIHGVLVMKKGSEKLSFDELGAEIEKIFVKTRLLK